MRALEDPAHEQDKADGIGEDEDCVEREREGPRRAPRLVLALVDRDRSHQQRPSRSRGAARTGRSRRLCATHAWPAMTTSAATKTGRRDSGAVLTFHCGSAVTLLRAAPGRPDRRAR